MKIKKYSTILAIVLAIIVITILVFWITSPKKPESELTEANSVPVYFVRTLSENNFRLTPVRRKLYKDESPLKAALSELLAGPSGSEKEQGYFSEIPRETELIELKETPERVIINLSKDFETGGGSASMTFRLEQLINTALDSVDKKPVYLQIEGKEVKHIGGEGIMVPSPLSRNLSRGQNI